VGYSSGMGRLLFIVLVNLGAYLVLRRLWPGVREGWRFRVLLGLAGLSLAAWALPMVLGRGSHGALPGLGIPLKFFGSGWLVASVMVMLGGLPFAFLGGRLGLGKRPAVLLPGEVDLRRRGLLVGMGRSVPLLAAGTSSVGIVSGASGFELRREEVRLRGLPPALDGFRIGLMTDVHVGAFIDVDSVRRAVAAMDAAGVDLQVMTGDLIDDLSQLDGTMAALEECQAAHGMLCVLGNHEHWRGLERVRAAYAASARRGGPVRLLVDEAHVLEHGGQRVRVVGVDYPMARRMPGAKLERMRRSAEVAFQGGSADEVVLCLSHHPDFFPLAAEKGARLTLSGHTHGGQVAFLGVPLFGFAFEHMLGRYRRGDSHLYVSGGTGHWLPFRLGVPAEVTILTLRAG